MIRVILLVLLLVPAWSFAQENDEETKEPSLAELARQERERRAQLQKVPVITNANIKRTGGGLVSTAAGPGAETEAPEGEEGAKAEENTTEKAETDPAVWDGRFGEARLNLKNAVNRDLVLQLKMNDLRNEYLSGNGPNRGKIQQQLLETQQDIEKNSQNVKTARQEMDTLQGEAAEEGVAEDRISNLVGESPASASIVTSPAE
jgi:hypothetical protein